MEHTRQERIERLIQKELGEMFLLQTKAMPGVIVSVSRCRVSPDLSYCNTYLSVFPSARAAEIVDNISKNVFINTVCHTLYVSPYVFRGQIAFYV